MMTVGVVDDKEDRGADVEILDLSEDERALEVGIEPPLSVEVW